MVIKQSSEEAVFMKQKIYIVEVFITVRVQMAVLWDMTHCTVVGG
jgi:hypothetical protein